MIKYLNTQFSDEEKNIIDLVTQRDNMELSIVYAVDINNIKGITNPNRMIAAGGLYLCEEKDEPSSWHMGEKINEQYDFWGNYGNLLDALEGL